EKAAAHQITSRMGGLPLAVDQAGAYIGQTGCSFEEYLDMCLAHEAQLLDDRVGDKRYPRSVIATLRTSLERAEASDAAAMELVRACAFLHPDGIPMDLLMGGVTQRSDKFGGEGSTTMAVSRAMGTLRRSSLVNRGQSGQDGERQEVDLVSMH